MRISQTLEHYHLNKSKIILHLTFAYFEFEFDLVSPFEIVCDPMKFSNQLYLNKPREAKTQKVLKIN